MSSAGTLRIKVLQATGLKDTDIMGLPDPYVLLKLGDEKKKTTIKNSTTDPIWNEEFYFSSASADQLLHIEIFDKDIVGKDSMGKATVPLSGLKQDTGSELTVPLTNKKGLRLGHLVLQLYPMGFGHSSQPAIPLPSFTPVPQKASLPGTASFPTAATHFHTQQTHASPTHNYSATTHQYTTPAHQYTPAPQGDNVFHLWNCHCGSVSYVKLPSGSREPPLQKCRACGRNDAKDWRYVRSFTNIMDAEEFKHLATATSHQTHGVY
eukprot:NODE_3709_length_916_cov_70.647655_g3557_i0.p1 GENE.NODE_3709_length_916_cov_70.647655_g3557_i0~~NODE_3709_length_916_cov_70.647655_g3557_i0.p1  ORF type:complete len:284 (+),score=67.47 NODE_3709_length_916_cov_70.647655_g3557_i0:58-852(+)